MFRVAAGSFTTGVTTAAVFRLSAETTVYDEIRFNQLHNGTDLDAGDEQARIPGGFDRAGWHVIDSKVLLANMLGRLASVRQPRLYHRSRLNQPHATLVAIVFGPRRCRSCP